MEITRRNMKWYSVVILVALTAGCSVIHQSAYEKFLKDRDARVAFSLAHEELSLEIRQAIADGVIIPGMEKRTIFQLFGEPDGKYVSETDMMEVWFYEDISFGFDKNGVLLKVFEFGNSLPRK